MTELYSNLGDGDAFWNTAWSPDGKRLAFLADGKGGAYDVYVINADGTGEQDISDSPEEESWPSWSPDGTRIAFVRMSDARPKERAIRATAEFRSYEGTLVVADPDGSHPVPLTGQPVIGNPAIWSPDATRLLGYVFNPNLATNDAIAVFDPSGRASPVTIPEVDFTSASWQRLAP
jgi:Tol biopolymer transport system component